MKENWRYKYWCEWLRNDLTFYESTAVLCIGYNPMAQGVFILKASQKLSYTFTVHLYTGNRKIILFSQILKPINT